VATVGSDTKNKAGRAGGGGGDDDAETRNTSKLAVDLMTELDETSEDVDAFEKKMSDRFDVHALREGVYVPTSFAEIKSLGDEWDMFKRKAQERRDEELERTREETRDAAAVAAAEEAEQRARNEAKSVVDKLIPAFAREGETASESDSAALFEPTYGALDGANAPENATSEEIAGSVIAHTKKQRKKRTVYVSTHEDYERREKSALAALEGDAEDSEGHKQAKNALETLLQHSAAATGVRHDAVEFSHSDSAAAAAAAAAADDEADRTSVKHFAMRANGNGFAPHERAKNAWSAGAWLLTSNTASLLATVSHCVKNSRKPLDTAFVIGRALTTALSDMSLNANLGDRVAVRDALGALPETLMRGYSRASASAASSDDDVNLEHTLAQTLDHIVNATSNGQAAHVQTSLARAAVAACEDGTHIPYIDVTSWALHASDKDLKRAAINSAALLNMTLLALSTAGKRDHCSLIARSVGAYMSATNALSYSTARKREYKQERAKASKAVAFATSPSSSPTRAATEAEAAGRDSRPSRFDAL